ncbi:MAG: hypothetical protein JKY70_11600 [Mucilaginibacter sp.]|nr:hypothetical protein [Mucilaginibacter sp.]
MRKNNALQRVSINSATPSGALLKQFATNALAGTVVLNEPGISIVQLKDGSILEFYGFGSFYAERIFDKGNMIVNFKVNDIQSSVKEFMNDGAALLDGITRPCSTYAYCYLLLNNEMVIGIYQEDTGSDVESAPDA